MTHRADQPVTTVDGAPQDIDSPSHLPSRSRCGDENVPSDDKPFSGLGDRFEFLERLGQGGMGEVYRAHDRQIDRDVAIKRIATVPGHPRHRLDREAALNARIEHEHVVGVYDVKETDRAFYIISEYVEGQSLDLLDKPVPWRRALEIGLDLARGLAAVHQCGILHRDIKPANAIWDRKHRKARLIDFGVAKVVANSQASNSSRRAASSQNPSLSPAITDVGMPATSAGARPGTPCYHAPEIWDGHEATLRSDVYSFGLLLYELCTGENPPYVGTPDTRRPIRLTHVDVDTRFAAIVNRCLEFDPGERFVSASELKCALDALNAVSAITENPYRGLLAFHGMHREFFFGRQGDSRRVIERLKSAPLVVMIGESGIGKSSLACAGVLPMVHNGHLDSGRDWQVATMVPNPKPLAGLAWQLAEHLDAEFEHVLRCVRSGESAAIARQLRARHAGHTGLVVFIDQLEELVTTCEEGEALAFDELLVYLIEQRIPGMHVLAAARGDKLPELAALPGLGRLLQDHLHIVRSLSAQGLRDAIVEPARQTGVRFESNELIATLIESTQRARGGLPLLQFTLSALWEVRDRDNDEITRTALTQIGGLEGALSKHADDVLDKLAGAAPRQAARGILVKLVTLQQTQIRRTRDELVSDDPVRAVVLEHLVKHRLLACHSMQGEWVYSIAHEALLIAWPTLRTWLDTERETCALLVQLAESADGWENLARAREALWGPRRLDHVTRIDARQLSPVEAAFVAASRRAVRRARWLRRGIVLLIFALVAAVGVVYAIGKYRDRKLAATYGSQGLIHLQSARVDRDSFDGRRNQALELARNSQNDWRKPWATAMAIDADIVTGYERAIAEFDAAYRLDPLFGEVRRHLVESIHELAEHAVDTGRHQERARLVARLASIDPERARRWTARVPVSVRIEPPSMGIRIQSYGSRGAPSSLLEVAATPPELAISPSGTVSLVPGSYLLTVPESDEYIEVRYPLLIRAGESAGSVKKIILNRPRKSAVPPGYVYVPAGSFLFGYGQKPRDDEYRDWYAAPPLHVRQTGAYLVAKYEITYAEWLEFLDTCQNDGCPGIETPPGEIRAEDQDMRLTVRKTSSGKWQIHWRPDASHEGYSALAGHHLVYEHRSERRSHDWLRFPVSGVSWYEVQLFLRWLREVKGISGAALCSEEQWERAARGADGRAFPHGASLAPDDANIDVRYAQDRRNFGPDTVGTYLASASPFGVYDMAGNIAEMVSTASTENAETTKVVVRGGSFFYSTVDSRVFSKWVIMPDQRLPMVGFRVCAAAPAE